MRGAAVGGETLLCTSFLSNVCELNANNELSMPARSIDSGHFVGAAIKHIPE